VARIRSERTLDVLFLSFSHAERYAALAQRARSFWFSREFTPTNRPAGPRDDVFPLRNVLSANSLPAPGIFPAATRITR